MTNQALLFITSFCLFTNMTPYSHSNQSMRLTTSPGINQVIQTDLHNDIEQTQFTNESYPKSKHILDLSNRNLTNAQLQTELAKIADPLSLHVLDISNNKLTGKIDLSSFINLMILDCSNNQIEQLSGLTPLLARIDCSNNHLGSLFLEHMIYTSDNDLVEMIEGLDFDPTKLGIQNKFSNQTIHLSVAKSATILGPKEFPLLAKNENMHDLKGASFVNGDNAIKVTADEFSYQYTVAKNNNFKPTPEYSLTVTVHLDRYDDGQIHNPSINIPGEIGQGTIGKQDETTKPQSIYRLYNPNSGEHFYTTSVQEKNHLVQVGWRYEGIGWQAPELSMQPVYRLYNPNAGDHHYTTNVNERNTLQTLGWKYEEISFYSDEFKSIPLYRQYNPNAISGAHNYTTDKHENDTLVSLGWRAEDIAWYALEK